MFNSSIARVVNLLALFAWSLLSANQNRPKPLRDPGKIPGVIYILLEKDFVVDFIGFSIM
jgi:hypothetical protein